MKLLKTIVNSQSFPQINGLEEARKWQRKAVRAVVFDDENNVALLYVGKHNYHKLPGGGVEVGEDLIAALKREMIEEIGCEIEIVEEIGRIDENREESHPMQINYCYLAKVIGEKGISNFDDYEKERKFELKWVALRDALKLLGSDQPDGVIGKFIVERDLILINEAKKIMEK